MFFFFYEITFGILVFRKHFQGNHYIHQYHTRAFALQNYRIRAQDKNHRNKDDQSQWPKHSKKRNFELSFAEKNFTNNH